ncbi:hypothetical protein LPW36_14385 [Jinshanibacter sp. LJY008]|uniref:Uncharacterized protein n=1 Tax=Limnobaculum eriocheiris TaxID=2897391 RepID=A0A9X1N0L8_9GAMM|nr:hypothetical protein [Limnobaculum eriocheiris]MCD1127167.1 hypothetical protein [Limnobaculum eriocheiris]
MSQDELQSFLQIQEVTFSAVAGRLKVKYPHQSLRIVVPKDFHDPIITDDLQCLKDRGVLQFNPGLKIFPMEIGCDHPVRLVIYYRELPIGFAFGNVNYSNQTIEILWMEKRNDAHEDLDHQFLGIVLDAYLTYVAVLLSTGIKINKFALVGPIHGVIAYYTQSGFAYEQNYLRQCDAMVRPILIPAESLVN